jgi:hypothetical protein
MPYEVMCPLIVGMDSLYFSCDLLLSQAMIAKLAAEKVTAQGMGKQAHCPEWLGARASAPRGPGHVTRHLGFPCLRLYVGVVGMRGGIPWACHTARATQAREALVVHDGTASALAGESGRSG